MTLLRSGLLMGGAYLMGKKDREDRGNRVAPQEFVGVPRENYPPANQPYGYPAYANGQGYDQSRQQYPPPPSPYQSTYANGQGYDQSRQQYPPPPSQNRYPLQDYGNNPQQPAYSPAPHQMQQNTTSGFSQQRKIQGSGQDYGRPRIPTYEEATSTPGSPASSATVPQREQCTEKSSNLC